MPLGLPDESAHRGQSLWRNMVLDPLRVPKGDGARDAQGQEEGLDDFMAFAGLVGEFGTSGRQENRSIGTCLNQSFLLEAGQGADNRDVAHAQRASNIDHASLALKASKFGNRLNIILGDLVGMGGPGQLVSLRGGGPGDSRRGLGLRKRHLGRSIGLPCGQCVRRAGCRTACSGSSWGHTQSRVGRIGRVKITDSHAGTTSIM